MPKSEDMPHQIQAVIDKDAIRDLIGSYSRAMDRIDPEIGHALWHEDGVADYGPTIYQGSSRGFVDWVCDIHRTMLGHSHQMTTITIAVDGDRAGSETYVTATLRFERDGKLMQMMTQGRYLDRWSRRAGRWGIDKRSFVLDFDELREVAGTSLEGWSRRDCNDPSYAVLSGTA